ncbi:fumarylacetoacetate hydrolase family protein [Spirochaeta cellobiosiphila]|uniref:fumarylacetoacetate hydrolase family protein n=1 Tax=Spirochaeta cellobiosiphila TaxID=504483 RepID=UPI0003FBE657|nr:fumarylacetoacetate hydrolase family protein [Spirochaeta cellobiosiphila]
MNNKVIQLVGLVIMSIAIITVMVMLTLSLVTSRPMFNEIFNENNLGSIRIYPKDKALSFARYRDNDSIQLMLVETYQNDIITGYNISSLDSEVSADPINFFNKYGYDGIIRLSEQNLVPISIPDNRLIKTADFENNNIAVGYNYISHLKELDEDEPPFLYPKKVIPDSFNTTINTKNYSLPDYELELGIVLLNDVTPKSQRQNYYGFLLVNDFTDRKPIVQKHVDVLLGKYDSLADGIQGYSDAKNKENAFPTGNLFIIPKEYKKFINELELKLYLNGELRQKARPQDLIWGPDKIIEEVFLRGNWKFEKENEYWYLLKNKNLIPSGTILLTGTPEGVIFKKTNMWNPFVFLRPGDDIHIIADGLGQINNKIIQ